MSHDREILGLVDVLAREKNVDVEIVFGAVEVALASATKKTLRYNEIDGEPDVVVRIDRHTGKYQGARRWLVVGDTECDFTENQIRHEDALETYPTITIGEYIESPLDAIPFGRIGAQTAKQVILQRIRDAEREQILQEFLDRREYIVTGTVKRVERGNAVIECGRLEAVLKRDQMIPKENLRVGDKVKAYLVRSERRADRPGRGPQLELSRTVNEFIIRLFEREVPEIEQGLIEIKAAARDAGLRAKIAVVSHDPKVDPQGTCIGVRGSRVQQVTNQLAGERVDIVLWSPEDAQFVINALAPASVNSIMVDEDRHSMDVIVEEDQLALAIGRGGQNVRLASEMTGWALNIMTVTEAQEKHDAEHEQVRTLFTNALGASLEVATILVDEGFTTLEEVAYVPMSEMVEIDGFDEAMVQDLRSRARDALLTLAIATEEKLETADLHGLAGADTDTIALLVSHGVDNRAALADFSVDELVELTAMDRERASGLIMAAREHLFS